MQITNMHAVISRFIYLIKDYIDIWFLYIINACTLLP